MYEGARSGTAAFLTSGADTDELLVAGGVVTVVPLLLFASAVRHAPLSLVGILRYISPTIQFLLGVFVFHEPFSRTQLSGLALVWLGLVVFGLDGVRRVNAGEVQPLARRSEAQPR